jgi:hypothetical protein
MVEQKARGWKILLPGLVSQAKSQAASATDSQPGEACEKFDEATFQRRLVNFIVADDQVCDSQFWFGSSSLTFPKSLNVIECREFRDLLLLLGNELKETMIPHRTKLRELIIVSWKRYFQTLRQDVVVLSVYQMFCLSLIPLIPLCLECCWPCVIHHGRVVRSQSSILLCHNGSLDWT